MAEDEEVIEERIAVAPAKKPGGSPRASEYLDPETGKFKPGNPGGPGFNANIPPCPAALKEVEAVWIALAKHASKSASAAQSLMSLYLQHTKAPEQKEKQKQEQQYSGLPDEVAAFLVEVDIGISEILRRDELGLPMADIEKVVAELAKALHDFGPKSEATRRWKRVFKRFVPEARNLVPLKDGPGRQIYMSTAEYDRWVKAGCPSDMLAPPPEE